MSNQPPFRAPKPSTAPAIARQPSEHLWTVRLQGHQYDCQLRDHGIWGIEVQVYRDLKFMSGGRWESRELAMRDADARKASFLREGAEWFTVA